MTAPARLGAVLALLISCVAVLAPQPVPAAIQLPGCRPLDSIDADTLIVAIRPAPPFVQEHPMGGLEGIAIELWEAIANRLKRDFAYVCLDLSKTLDALNDGSIDIAVSPLTISSAREELFDFSHQYFTSRLVFAGPPDRITFDVSKIVNALLDLVQSRLVLYGLGAVLVLSLVFTVIGTIFAHNYNPAAGKIGPQRAALAGHMFVISILNLIGITHREFLRFRSVALQLLFLITLTMGIVFSATVGGIVTTVFLTSAHRSTLVDESELPFHRISTLVGSTAETYLIERTKKSDAEGTGHIVWKRRDTWEDTLHDIVRRDADLVVGDWAQLTYLANQPQFTRKVHIGSRVIRFEPYGWGLPAGSPLREEVNRVLIEILRSDPWPVTVRRYMGTDHFQE